MPRKTFKEKLIETLEKHEITTATENGRVFFRVATDDDSEFIVYAEQDEYAAGQWTLKAFPLLTVKNATWQDVELLKAIVQWCSVLALAPVVHPINGGVAIGFQRIVSPTDLWAQIEDFVMDVAVVREKLIQTGLIEWEFAL